MEKKLSYKVFFEKTFNPIALYSVDMSAENLTSSEIRYLDVNPAYEKVNNVKREEMIGKSFAEAWPDVEQCWSKIIEDCIREKRVMHCESESVYTDKYLEAIAFPLTDDMAATIFLDRTEWKQAQNTLIKKEKKLLRYRTMLRELVTKLTLSEEETRREIASDLHDSLGHSLISLLFNLRNLELESTLSAPSRTLLCESIKETERMITESRQLIFELSPPILLEVGLAPALEALADHLLTPRGIKWTVTTRGLQKNFPADDAVCVILYRMARELIINVIKHSKATKVEIGVNRGPNVIQVVIEDNGEGMPEKFHMERKHGTGIGLFSIQERLIHIRGNMQIISNTKGTTISLLAPRNLIDKSLEDGEIAHEN